MKRAQIDAFCGCRETLYQRIAFFAAPTILLAGVVYVAVRYASLPAEIPTHYNAFGEIDGWGSRGTLWITPVIGILCDALMLAVSFFPQTWNVGTSVTVFNRALVYRRVRDLIAMREERAQRRKRIGSVHMEAQEAEKSGKLVMEAVNLGFTYPDGYEVFHDFSAIIQRGDRIGIIGDNGTGKTTLLRVLLGELQPTSGTLKRGTNLEISYFDQLRETLDPNATIMDSVANGSDVVTINGKKRHVAGYLTDFLFAPGRLRVPVHTLSGGEKNRLLLARLFTKPSNLLVMDEPTNDLDMETLELLEELLAEYTGTAIMVSHDRAFLDDLATSTFALEGDRLIHEYVGGYTDWLRQRPEPKEKTQKAPRPQPKPDAAKGRKLTFKEQREQKMLQEELDGMPARSEALEKEQAELEQRLADPDLFQRDPDLFNATTKRMPELEQEQNALLERWEAVEARLKELADITKKV